MASWRPNYQEGWQWLRGIQRTLRPTVPILKELTMWWGENMCALYTAKTYNIRPCERSVKTGKLGVFPLSLSPICSKDSEQHLTVQTGPSWPTSLPSSPSSLSPPLPCVSQLQWTPLSLFAILAHANPRLEHSLPAYYQSPGPSTVLIPRKPPLILTLSAGVLVHHDRLCSQL